MLEVVVEWWKTKGLTWERMVSGRHVKSRIDLIFYKGEKIIRKVRKLKLLLDHWAFFFFFFFKSRNPACSLMPWQGDAIPRHRKGAQKRQKSYIHNHHNPRQALAKGTDLLANS